MATKSLDESYAEIQKAQVNYILTLRDLAISDHLTAAYYLSISKIDAHRLASTSIPDIHLFFAKCPPLLTLKAFDVDVKRRGNSPVSVILDFIHEGRDPSEFETTLAHITALPNMPFLKKDID